ncbi:response regulator [Devosia naphthalenivorans]|uniref:response regulator n=1 Tax=Devosia naphthalenivorans TaxID=2082392 RepID=UPI000D3C8DAF|nr:response regulator [Devosia naphthalenivorans]
MSRNASIALLLEDEPLIALDMEEMLGSAGFDVKTVMSCEQANEWLAICRPDIVIVDIELRDGTSDEVVERLVQNHIPFVVHSGEHPSMHVGTPFAHGRWISKPATPDELIDAARSLLSP